MRKSILTRSHFADESQGSYKSSTAVLSGPDNQAILARCHEQAPLSTRSLCCM